MTAVGVDAGPTERAGWPVVAAQECRDLWASGRGPVLMFAFSVLLSAVTYLAATNQVLDYLAQRDAVNLVLGIAVTVGVLMALLVSADSISGERERGTLESLLLAPVSRRTIVVGKLAAALTLWLAAFVVSMPYLLVLGNDVAVGGQAILLSLVVGTPLAFALAALGLLVSALANTNRASLSVSLLLLLALFALTQLPAAPQQSWFAELLVGVNPVGSGLHYISLVLVRQQSGAAQLYYLVSPALAVALAGVALGTVVPRLVRLTRR